MADPDSIEKTIKKIKKKWDQDKENWIVLSGTDRDGNQEFLIDQAPNSYWLKMRKISDRSSMALGKELRNIDEDITKNLMGDRQLKSIQSEADLLQLFGLVVPSRKDNTVYSMNGAGLYSPEKIQAQKAKIEEKETDADKMYRLYLQKKWAREQALREGMYL